MLRTDRLKALREGIQLTQEGMAYRLGVARSTYACWETGSRVPELAKVIALADMGGVSVDWILGRSDQMTVDKNRHPDKGLLVFYQGHRQFLGSHLAKMLESMLEDKEEKSK